jgi:hypothetical protein
MMLTYFQCEFAHYGTVVKVHVDLKSHEATYLVLHQGVIVQHGPIHALVPGTTWREVATPEQVRDLIRARIEGIHFSAQLLTSLSTHTVGV